MKKSISILLIVVILSTFCACSPAKETAPIVLKSGETVQLLATDIYNKLGNDAEVEWVSSNEEVVKVASGKITYVGEGEAVVTANGTSANSKKTCSNDFNVKCLKADGGVKLNTYSLIFDNDGERAYLTATLTDETDRIKKWSSSDESIATVADGKVTRVSKGRAQIKVETSYGYEAVCNVVCDSVVMQLGDVEITDAMYEYWLASYKTQMVEYYLGEDSPEVWATEIDENGTTFQMMFMDDCKTAVEQMLESAYLYFQDNEGVSEEILTSVNEQIKEAVETNGGEESFNVILSKFNADTELLKQIFIFEEITNHVYEDLFGENGTDKITDEIIKEYFYENYVKAQHVFFDLNYAFDDEGNYSYLTDTQKSEKRTQAEDIWTKIQNGTIDYNTAVKEYSDDTEDTYDGFVFENGDYDQTFSDCVFSMQVGELKKLETSYGIHLIKKLQLSEDDLNDNIKYVIQEMITRQVFDEKLSALGNDIVISEKIDQYDIVNMPIFSSIE